MKSLCLLLFVFFFTYAFSTNRLELTLVTSEHCPHSPLSRLQKEKLLFIGKRSRFSTCTAVAWFHDQTHLVTANLINSSMQTFEFDEQKATLHPIQFLTSFMGTKLAKPEHLDISSDGALMAVANGCNGTLNFYAVDACLLNPIPIAVLKETEKTKFHSVRFSPDGQFLAYVTFDNHSHICILRIHSEKGKLSFSPSQRIDNPFDPLKPKGISFSPDQKFIAICYSKRATGTPNSNFQSAVEMYAFDSVFGTFDPKPLSRIETNLCVPEDLLFDPLQSYIFVSNQGNDTITVHEYDPKSGAIQEALRACLKNPEAKLSFPHGISITKNGKYLASSNYGDDKVTVYKIERQDL